jgi:O-antigen/teichoic acid export membrane protein
MLCIALLVSTIYKKYCFLKYEECRQKAKYDKGIFREMFSFAGWNFLGALSQICRNQGVNILLNIFGGVVVNAAQGITNQVNTAVTQFVSNFTIALNPQIIKSYSLKDEAYFHKLIYTGSKISFILMTIISIPIILEVDYILHLWLKEAPFYTNNFVILILVTSIITSWTGPVSIAISATGQIKKYSLSLSLINIVILPGSYLFLKIGYEPMVVYIIYIYAQLLTTSVILYLSKRLLYLDPFYFIRKNIIPISIVAIISTIVLFKIQSFFGESFLRLISIVFFSTILLGIQYYFIVFSKDEKKMMKQMLINAKNKIIPSKS